MLKNFKVIDADSHVLEPLDMWDRYIDPAYRDRAPKTSVNADGDEIFRVEEKAVGNEVGRGFERGIGHIGSFGAVFGKQGDLRAKYMTTRGGYDPDARIKHMDSEGIDATILYPSLGLVLGSFQDPLLAQACYRAYNRWLADFCRPHPKRLVGAAMIPMQSVELAVAELRYARKELGMKIAFVRPQPYLGRRLDNRIYDPVWQEAQELDMAIAVHSATSFDMPALGRERFPDLVSGHIVVHSFEGMSAVVSLVFLGVCDRFPRLRFGFFEGGGGWMPGWLDRMDRHYEKVHKECHLKHFPSEIFRRQCYVTFDPTEKALASVVDYIGADRVLVATDYPHPDGVPQGMSIIADHPTMPEATKKRILCDNPTTFYGL